MFQSNVDFCQLGLTKSVQIFSSLVKVHIRLKYRWDCITLFQMKQNWLWTVSYQCTQFYNHMQSLVLNTGGQSLHLPACFHFPLPCRKVGQHPNKPASLGKHSSHNIMKSSTFQFVYNKNSKNTELYDCSWRVSLLQTSKWLLSIHCDMLEGAQ